MPTLAACLTATSSASKTLAALFVFTTASRAWCRSASSAQSPSSAQRRSSMWARWEDQSPRIETIRGVLVNYLSSDELFWLNVQVLKAKVLQCDPDKAKMLLSFKAAVEGDTGESAKPQVDCEVGKVSHWLHASRSLSPISVYQNMTSTCLFMWCREWRRGCWKSQSTAWRWPSSLMRTVPCYPQCTYPITCPTALCCGRTFRRETTSQTSCATARTSRILYPVHKESGVLCEPCHNWIVNP